jgi:hypothetical protein
MKLAVTVAVPVTVKFCGLAVPVRAPVKPENRYPLFGVAVMATTEPLLYQPLAG